jgi:hypothetical protein
MKIKINILLWAILYMFSLLGCNVARVINASKDSKISFSEEATKFNYLNNQIHIITELPNGDKRNFLLDLGSPISIIFLDSTTNNLFYGDKITQKKQKSLSADGKNVSREYLKWGNIKTNWFEIENSVLSTIYRNDPFDCNNLGGIWGADIFAQDIKGKRNKILLIKMQDSTVSILDKLPPLENWTKLNTHFNIVSHIKVLTSIYKSKTKTMFDTGYTGSLILKNKVFKSIQRQDSNLLSNIQTVYGHLHSSLAGSAAPDTAYTGIMSLKLTPGLQIDSIQVVTTPNMIVNAMGMDLIKRFNRLVDYQKQNLYLQPNPAYFKPKKNIFQLSGFKARSPGNKELIVVNMVAGSLAEKAGMKIGDQIVSINNIRVDEINPCETYRTFEELGCESTGNEIIVKRRSEILKFIL